MPVYLRTVGEEINDVAFSDTLTGKDLVAFYDFLDRHGNKTRSKVVRKTLDDMKAIVGDEIIAESAYD